MSNVFIGLLLFVGLLLLLIVPLVLLLNWAVGGCERELREWQRELRAAERDQKRRWAWLHKNKE